MAFTTNKISICPTQNLISNIGFRKDATHTTSENSFAETLTLPMLFPMKSPLSKEINYLAENLCNKKEGIRVSFLHFLLKELKYFILNKCKFIFNNYDK
jgi:hypothetical protein